MVVAVSRKALLIYTLSDLSILVDEIQQPQATQHHN